MKIDRKEHWENIYKKKDLREASWYQATPATSMNFFKQFNIPLTAKIIDVGGGDSLLVDHLLALGYQDLTVLDISETAIAIAQQRLGAKAAKVKWVVADAATFEPTEAYDFWHDRATFHFLTEEVEISHYLQTAHQHIKEGGILVIGTFSDKGPRVCSGFEIKQYSEARMTERLRKLFKKIKCLTVDHFTPSGVPQNFLFCSFKKLSVA
ncbi:MAG: class I SAM-dependent methyltransferase [Cyclobacteriaceae bacterium]|nr:class I SAM-dependent methyltransferase [Cyclobacteriaceae bacterium]